MCGVEDDADVGPAAPAARSPRPQLDRGVVLLAWASRSTSAISSRSGSAQGVACRVQESRAASRWRASLVRNLESDIDSPGAARNHCALLYFCVPLAGSANGFGNALQRSEHRTSSPYVPTLDADHVLVLLS